MTSRLAVSLSTPFVLRYTLYALYSMTSRIHHHAHIHPISRACSHSIEKETTLYLLHRLHTPHCPGPYFRTSLYFSFTDVPTPGGHSYSVCIFLFEFCVSLFLHTQYRSGVRTDWGSPGDAGKVTLEQLLWSDGMTTATTGPQGQS